MNVKKWLTGALAGSMLAGMAAVALAGPALAQDNGPEIEGEIFILRNAGGVAGNTAGDVVTGYTRTGGGSGSFVIGGETVPGVGTHPRPGLSVATTAAPPEGWASAQLRVQLPVAGQPESEWEEIFYQQQGGWTEDSLGFYFNNNNIDRFNKSQIFARTSGGATVELPLIIGFYDIDGYPLGNVRTTMTFSGTDDNNYSWSLPTPTWPATGGDPAVATTTTLTGAGAGTDLVLTATVEPSEAAGTVAFSEGSTPLGTETVVGGTASVTVPAPSIGAHTYTATFTPSDPAAFATSSDTKSFAIGTVEGSGDITVTLVVPQAPPGEPGALTFAVSGSTAALDGTRDSGNTRVTATAALPRITVTDTRRDDLLGLWEVNAQASDFTGTAGTVGAKYLGWTPHLEFTKDPGAPLVVQTGAAVASFLDDPTSAGLGASQALGRTTVAGRGITLLDAQLNFAVPTTDVTDGGGQYASTITVTLIGG